eukprot:9485268-Pyramimonas_sp.AAC.1
MGWFPQERHAKGGRSRGEGMRRPGPSVAMRGRTYTTGMPRAAPPHQQARFAGIRRSSRQRAA